MSKLLQKTTPEAARAAGGSDRDRHGSMRAEAQISLARLHLENDREDEAIPLLNEVLRADFHHADARLLAAAAHEKLGTLAEAADHLSAILAVEPDHLDANRRLAAILGHLGDTRGFVRCLRKIVALTEAKDLDSLSMLGIGLSEDGQHWEALEILRKLAGARPGLSSAHADLGMALHNAGRLDEAVEAMREALALDPTSAQAYCGIGLCYRQAGRWQEAAQAFMSTEQLAPQLEIGPFNLALVLEMLGDINGARQALFRAAAVNPNDEEIERALERFLLKPGSEESGHLAGAAAAEFDASMRGDLTSFPLLDVLEFLRVQSKTGALAVTSRRGTGGVRMVRGQVTSGSAPGVKRIGEALVEAGLVTPARLEWVLEKQRAPAASPADGTGSASQEALGTVLIREKIVGLESMKALLSRQIRNALTEMLTWKEGAFSFHPERDEDLPPISFNVQGILLDLARISDERKGPQSAPSRKEVT